MTDFFTPGDRVRQTRTAMGWSQATLAERAGVSRAAVSAVEANRLAPSVNAALAIARELGASVEDLFGESDVEERVAWAWSAAQDDPNGVPHWRAEAFGRTLRYPIESTAAGYLTPDDPNLADAKADSSGRALAIRTLVVASCDPAAGILVDLLAKTAGIRAIVLPRSSGAALELLRQGLVHVAGLHYSNDEDAGANLSTAQDRLGPGHILLRAAAWETGVATAPSLKLRRVSQALAGKLRWVGRDAGSAASERIRELFAGRRMPRRVAHSHRGVAEAIRSDFADAGVTLRLTGAEAGLDFLGLRRESYDLCFPASMQDDVRVRALVDVARSPAYRRAVGDLPGYDARDAGEIAAA